jgi:hypothetical protein
MSVGARTGGAMPVGVKTGGARTGGAAAGPDRRARLVFGLPLA